MQENYRDKVEEIGFACMIRSEWYSEKSLDFIRKATDSKY